jgi:carbon-monoxide dehydrogenase catalytic subunit
MEDLKNPKSRSTDPAVQQVLAKSEGMDVTTVWDRYGAMVPQCGFGDTGLCCRHCLQGPCRIDPFGEGAKTGICGATADTMVARGLDRAIAAGTAAHSGHARHLAHTLLKMAKGETTAYEIKDAQKLKAVATRLNIAVKGRKEKEIALDVANAALADFHEKETPVLWAATVVTPERAQTLTDLNLVPKGGGRPGRLLYGYGFSRHPLWDTTTHSDRGQPGHPQSRCH